MKKITIDLRKSGIYCIINIKNGKKYIGSSKNIFQRLSKHRSMLRKNNHQNRKLQNSWNKHQEENFEYFILEYCEENNLEIREQHYINTLNPEYNITLIVERNILSKESRILQSETRKKKIASGEIILIGRKIYQYDLNGKFITSYDRINIASKINNISESTIGRCLNKTYKKGGGYLWSYDYYDQISPYIKTSRNIEKLYKAVQVLDLKTNKIIFEFNSIKACAEYFKTFHSSISYAIKVKQKFKQKYMIQFKSA